MTTAPEILFQHDAPSDAPIACDMSDAVDTPQERIDAYEQLFAEALTGRELEGPVVRLVLVDEPGVSNRLVEMARREAA